MAIHVPSVVRHLSVDGPLRRLAERHTEEVPAQVGQDRLGVGEVLWLPRWQGVRLNFTVAQHEGDRCDVCTGQRDLCGGTGTGNRHRLGTVNRAQIIEMHHPSWTSGWMDTSAKSLAGVVPGERS